MDKNGGEWITTKSGVLYFKNGDLSREPELFFKGISVSSIHESIDGSLWVTSTDNGLYHVPNINIRHSKPKGWTEGEAIYNIRIIENRLLLRSEKTKLFILNEELSDYSDRVAYSGNKLQKEIVPSISRRYRFDLLPSEYIIKTL